MFTYKSIYFLHVHVPVIICKNGIFTWTVYSQSLACSKLKYFYHAPNLLKKNVQLWNEKKENGIPYKKQKMNQSLPLHVNVLFNHAYRMRDLVVVVNCSLVWYIVVAVFRRLFKITAWRRSSDFVAPSPLLGSFSWPRPLPCSPARPSHCRSRETSPLQIQLIISSKIAASFALHV